MNGDLSDFLASISLSSSENYLGGIDLIFERAFYRGIERDRERERENLIFEKEGKHRNTDL